jgi:D-alanyl-D-alanine carboxypeptidase (penicillin-binding protein 5/6)
LGYTAYEALRLSPEGAPVSSPRVWKGKSDVVKLGTPEGVVVSVPAGEGVRLKTEITRPDPLVAPLQRGQQVGVLRVRLGSGDPVADVPLTVLETVEESGMLGRAWDALRLWIQ